MRVNQSTVYCHSLSPVASQERQLKAKPGALHSSRLQPLSQIQDPPKRGNNQTLSLFLQLRCLQSTTKSVWCVYGKTIVESFLEKIFTIGERTATMSNKKGLSFSQRAIEHPHPLAKKLFQVAERKQTNIVLSADLTTTKELLTIADIKSTPRNTCETTSTSVQR